VLDLQVALDVVTQRGDLVVGEVLGVLVLMDTGRGQDFVGAGTADAVDVGQRDLHALIARQVDAHKSSHGWHSSFVAEVVIPARSRLTAPGPGLRSGRM